MMHWVLCALSGPHSERAERETIRTDGTMMVASPRPPQSPVAAQRADRSAAEWLQTQRQSELCVASPLGNHWELGTSRVGKMRIEVETNWKEPGGGAGPGGAGTDFPTRPSCACR